MWLVTNKYRDLFRAASEELETVQNALQLERAKRISAETIAQERLQQLERAWECANRAESSRQEAISERMKSLDLVNTHLLKLHSTETTQAIDLKNFKTIQKAKRQAVPLMREADRMFRDAVMKMAYQRMHKQDAPPKNPIQ